MIINVVDEVLAHINFLCTTAQKHMVASPLVMQLEEQLCFPGMLVDELVQFLNNLRVNVFGRDGDSDAVNGTLLDSR